MALKVGKKPADGLDRCYSRFANWKERMPSPHRENVRSIELRPVSSSSGCLRLCILIVEVPSGTIPGEMSDRCQAGTANPRNPTVAAPRSKPYFTVDQYLAIERASEERHIYLDGEIYAMAGESDAHGIISVNIVGTLHTLLKGTPCQVRTKDTKVRSGPTAMPGHAPRGLFSYPDVLVICGVPEYHDAFTDVVLNPTAIIEVLSQTTEGFDRGEKFTRYQSYNPTLGEYVLV